MSIVLKVLEVIKCMKMKVKELNTSLSTDANILFLLLGDGMWKRKEKIKGGVGGGKMSWVWCLWDCSAL